MIYTRHVLIHGENARTTTRCLIFNIPTWLKAAFVRPIISNIHIARDPRPAIPQFLIFRWSEADIRQELIFSLLESEKLEIVKIHPTLVDTIYQRYVKLGNLDSTGSLVYFLACELLILTAVRAKLAGTQEQRRLREQLRRVGRGLLRLQSGQLLFRVRGHVRHAAGGRSAGCDRWRGHQRRR